MIFKLVDIVSKGGNYLLNIGPKANGEIPKESIQILTTIGKWLKPNSESIYGTKHSPFYVDNINWRCTQKANTLYFHILNWSQQIEINGLQSKVVKATFLETGEAVNYTQTQQKLTLSLPIKPINAFNSVIKVTIEDTTPSISKEFDATAQKDTIDLFALEARYRGEGTYYDWESSTATNIHGDLSWYIQNIRYGSYSAQVIYACEAKDSGSGILFDGFENMNAFEDIDYEKNKRNNFTIQNTNGKFKTFDLPDIEITKNTKQVVFRLTNQKATDLKISKIILIKK